MRCYRPGPPPRVCLCSRETRRSKGRQGRTGCAMQRANYAVGRHGRGPNSSTLVARTAWPLRRMSCRHCAKPSNAAPGGIPGARHNDLWSQASEMGDVAENSPPRCRVDSRCTRKVHGHDIVRAGRWWCRCPQVLLAHDTSAVLCGLGRHAVQKRLPARFISHILSEEWCIASERSCFVGPSCRDPPDLPPRQSHPCSRPT